MTVFAVVYDYGMSTTESRDTHRPKHVEFLQTLFDDKRLLASGPLGPDDAPGALLLLEGETIDEIETVLDNDPFRRNDLIANREIRPWRIVFGDLLR